MSLPAAVTSDAPDRRRRRRMMLSYPLRLYGAGEGFPTETTTEDISCEGFFCITQREFFASQVLECELTISSQEPAPLEERAMILRCRVEVVRVVPLCDRERFGVACRLTDYTIAREIVESGRAVETCR